MVVDLSLLVRESMDQEVLSPLEIRYPISFRVSPFFIGKYRANCGASLGDTNNRGNNRLGTG